MSITLSLSKVTLVLGWGFTVVQSLTVLSNEDVVSNKNIALLIFFIVPSLPPDDVTALTVSSTSMLVIRNMVPAIDQNGVITMNTVMYTPLRDITGTMWTQTINVSDQSVASDRPTRIYQLHHFCPSLH